VEADATLDPAAWGGAGHSGPAEGKEASMSLPVKNHNRGSDRTPATQSSDQASSFQDIQTQMSRLFQDPSGMFGGVLGSLLPWAPAIDIEETDDAYMVEMELPGAKSDDVSIDVSGNEVRVYGEIKKRERKGILRRQTRKVGEFDYRFTLPVDIDADEITAEMSDGVLTLRAPKLQSAQPRRITVSGR
jgi:HSP20 family protein